MRILHWWQWLVLAVAVYLTVDVFTHGGPARRLDEWRYMIQDTVRLRH